MLLAGAGWQARIFAPRSSKRRSLPMSFPEIEIEKSPLEQIDKGRGECY